MKDFSGIKILLPVLLLALIISGCSMKKQAPERESGSVKDTSAVLTESVSAESDTAEETESVGSAEMTAPAAQNASGNAMLAGAAVKETPGADETEQAEKTSEHTEEIPGANLKGYVESDREKEIYSYLQVPVRYSKDPVWSGDWTYIEAGGQKFFWFGCGICCLSNICSTFSGTPVPPDVMFEEACEQTDYDPDSGVGALSWGQLKSMTKSFGAEASVKLKPDDYSRFQEDAEEADTMVVLVCKDDDDKLWYHTKGHYVNLWEYDPETDTVFVTDSSGMFNRTRVDLKDVYNALKTSSSAQYMTVKK